MEDLFVCWFSSIRLCNRMCASVCRRTQSHEIFDWIFLGSHIITKHWKCFLIYTDVYYYSQGVESIRLIHQSSLKMVDVLLFLRILSFLSLSLSLSVCLSLLPYSATLFHLSSCSLRIISYTVDGSFGINTDCGADWSVSVRVAFSSSLLFFLSLSYFFSNIHLSQFFSSHLLECIFFFSAYRWKRIRYVTQVQAMCTKIKYLEHDCTRIAMGTSVNV